MALSVPVNGLKEGDKEPVIELFVKVKAEGWWPGSGAERAAPRPLVAPSPNRRFPALRRGWRGGGGSKFSSATRSGPLHPGGPGRGGDRAPPSPPTVGAPFLSYPPPPAPSKLPEAGGEAGRRVSPHGGSGLGCRRRLVVRLGAGRLGTKGPFGWGGFEGGCVCPERGGSAGNRG